MTWKIAIQKENTTTHIGKRWLKKNVPNKDRIPKHIHALEECNSDIYNISNVVLKGEADPKNIWVAFRTGQIYTKAPPIRKGIIRVVTKKKAVTTTTQKVKVVTKKVKPSQKSAFKSKTKQIEPEITKAGVKQDVISVSEVKGIGAKALVDLENVGIKTVHDLLNKSSTDIMNLLGRKSDKMIIKWQENARVLHK